MTEREDSEREELRAERMEASEVSRFRYLRKLKRVPTLSIKLAKKAAVVREREGFFGLFAAAYRQVRKTRGRFWIIHDSRYFYRMWIAKNERLDKEAIKKEAKRFTYRPKISILVPVYNVEAKWLDRCLESVLDQHYDNWELCIYDDASTKKETLERLKKWEELGDPRVKISYGKVNKHIAAASNEALKMATGEFIALLDNDDELSPLALHENIKLLNRHPEADMIYSDEDKIDVDGERCDPFFKPDWNPDMFLSVMYTCHLGVYRKSLVDKIGGFREGYEGSQDYDLVLRLIEKTKPANIFHIPKVLYHWRLVGTSTALNSRSKGYAYDAGRAALSDYLKRNGIPGRVEEGVAKGFYRVVRELNGRPVVSIVIPFRDMPEILDRCLRSIKKTTYPNYEIILVNNLSERQETLDYLSGLTDDERVKVIDFEKPFNYSAINNLAARHARGDYLLFLNNDTEVINETWLDAMMEQAQRPEVGIVGAKLLFPDDTVQHAGVIIGLGGVAGHVYQQYGKDDPGYFGQLQSIRNYSAVTAACMVVRKELFFEVGGFDERNLPVAFNDIDLCLKIRKKGYLVVFTPYAQLYHHESLTRGHDDDAKDRDPVEYRRVMRERDYFKKKWKAVIDHDPYYNPNLSLGNDDKLWPQQLQSN